MVTYRQLSKLRKFVIVAPHAIKQYRTRIDGKINEVLTKQRLINAYLRGDLIPVSPKKSLRQTIKYLKDAVYYKYGNLIVVVHEYGPRYDPCEKVILTCYSYKNSKFDPGVFD